MVLTTPHRLSTKHVDVKHILVEQLLGGDALSRPGIIPRTLLVHWCQVTNVPGTRYETSL